MRTQEEITAEINELQRLRGVIPPFSTFGDDNLEQIDAGIAALRDETDCSDDWYGKDDDDEDPVVWWAYRDAWEWKMGNLNEVPSEGWSLLERKVN
jgi:hypothetical protein